MSPIWSTGWGLHLTKLSLNWCLIYQGKEGHTHTVMHTLSCKKQIKTSDRGLGTKGQEDKEVVFVCVCMRCVCVWVCVCVCVCARVCVFLETDAVQLLTCHLSSRRKFYVCVYRGKMRRKRKKQGVRCRCLTASRPTTRYNGRLLYERSWRGRTEKKRRRTSAIFRYCSVVWAFLHNILSLNRPGKRPAHYLLCRVREPCYGNIVVVSHVFLRFQMRFFLHLKTISCIITCYEKSKNNYIKS